MSPETEETLKIVSTLLVGVVVAAFMAFLMSWLPIFAGWSFWQCIGLQVLLKHVLSFIRPNVTVAVEGKQP